MADQEDPSSGSVVCLGEAMAQILPTDGLRLDAAQEFAVGLAGAESNVAISLARLGTPSAWAGIVGDDPLGTRILGELLDWGVDTAQSQRAVGGRTGVFLKDPSPTRSDVYYYRSGSAAARMDAEFARNVVSRQPRWMHVTGVTPALSRTCAEALGATLSCAREVGVPVSFDVNYRRTLWADVKQAAATIREAANQADVVFVGLDEAHALWGTELAEDPCTPPLTLLRGGQGCCALEARRSAGPALPSSRRWPWTSWNRWERETRSRPGGCTRTCLEWTPVPVCDWGT